MNHDDPITLHRKLAAAADKLGFTIRIEQGVNSYTVAAETRPGKVWALTKTATLSCQSPGNSPAWRASALADVIDSVWQSVARSPDQSGMEPTIQVATTVAEVDPAQAVRDMRARIGGLATDDMASRVALAACIDLTREQFQLMLGAVPADMAFERRVISDTLNALDAELMFQLKLMRERREDRRGGGLR